MKKLQNNFTTPEQSKRLLELGVPEDSADMYFQDGETRPIVRFVNSEGFFGRNDDCSPCWSAGRLIEILMITFTEWSGNEYMDKISIRKSRYETTGIIEGFVQMLERCKCCGHFNFQKLEE